MLIISFTNYSDIIVTPASHWTGKLFSDLSEYRKHAGVDAIVYCSEVTE